MVTKQATLRKAKASLSSGQLCWSIGTLKAGATAVRSFAVRVDADAKAGTIVNHATVDRTKVKGTDAKAKRGVKVLKSNVKPATANGGVTG